MLISPPREMIPATSPIFSRLVTQAYAIFFSADFDFSPSRPGEPRPERACAVIAVEKRPSLAIIFGGYYSRRSSTCTRGRRPRPLQYQLHTRTHALRPAFYYSRLLSFLTARYRYRHLLLLVDFLFRLIRWAHFAPDAHTADTSAFSYIGAQV